MPKRRPGPKVRRSAVAVIAEVVGTVAADSSRRAELRRAAVRRPAARPLRRAVRRRRRDASAACRCIGPKHRQPPSLQRRRGLVVCRGGRYANQACRAVRRNGRGGRSSLTASVRGTDAIRGAFRVRRMEAALSGVHALSVAGERALSGVFLLCLYVGPALSGVQVPRRGHPVLVAGAAVRCYLVRGSQAGCAGSSARSASSNEMPSASATPRP